MPKMQNFPLAPNENGTKKKWAHTKFTWVKNKVGAGFSSLLIKMHFPHGNEKFESKVFTPKIFEVFGHIKNIFEMHRGECVLNEVNLDFIFNGAFL